VFPHLPSVGYSEAKAYNANDPLATRWKALRGFGLALLVKERLVDLQMDVVI